MTPLDLRNQDAYFESCLRLAGELLADFWSPEEVLKAEARINAYPGLEALGPPKSVRVLEDFTGLEELGRRAVLDGRVMLEHSAAGEATRLGLGPKFSLTPQALIREAASFLPGDDFSDLLPVSLGLRHLIQPVLETRRLAVESGLDPAEVVARQRVLLVTGENHVEPMGLPALRALARLIPPERLWIMGQKAFHGLWRPKGGEWTMDPNSPKRLHNHGQMAMQKTMEGQIKKLSASGGLMALSSSEVAEVWGELEDLVSFNIEDLDYLSRAIDFECLGLAVRLGRSGYGMVMELVPNNLHRPVKGGMCAFDPALDRDVMVESFRLMDLAPKDVLFLNKNFNHYPRPARVFGRLREGGLFMPVRVFDSRVYFQPVQGDLNFLIRTAFFTRREAKRLNPLKTAADIPAALEAMRRQDAQPGFRELAEEIQGR